MIESTISSPSPIAMRPKLSATRLIASVAFAVKMISSVCAALRKRAHRLARLLVGFGRGVGEEMQAAMDVGVFVACRRGVTASITACGFCAEAPLSR